MASVAICPHCYLQLIVPDGVERDEPVECPTCAKEFDLSQAVLRAIPEIVRRKSDVVPAVEAVPAKEAVQASDTVSEIDAFAEDTVPDLDATLEIDDRMPTADHEINKLVEAAAKSGAEQETEFVEQMKARIEAELAAGGLKAGAPSTIPLESLDIEVGDDVVESAEATKDDFASWFRDTKSNMELPADVDFVEEATVEEASAEEVLADDPPEEIAAEELPSELALDESVVADEMTPLADEAALVDEIAEVVAEADVVAELGLEDEITAADPVDTADEVAEELEVGIEEIVERIDEPEVLADVKEPRFTRPSATTLADLLPQRDMPETAPGPSFELPNVPLTPSNGATVEFDSISSLGPSAETEFELENVDFDAVSTEESAADEAQVSDELEVEAPTEEADEPVFREPAAGALPAAPFVIPGVPRPRKKRSLVRTLVGAGLGGAFGTAAALYFLLWWLGRDGDFLNVAQYLPDAVLPASLKSSQPQVAMSSPNTLPATEPSSNEPSTNQQASYVEETPATGAAETEQPLTDDRYGSEPSPLDEPTAEPIASESSATESTASNSVAPVPLPFQGPTYTIEQLATALEVAKEAESGLVTGDLSDEAVRRTKGMSYSKLCDLANALTFVDRSAPSVESEQAVAGAEQLFGETLADSHTRSEVARIASVWMNSPHRGHGGIFVAGTLSGGANVGDVYEYQFTASSGSPLMTADEKPVTVLMREPLDPLLAGSAELGIVGHILEHPRDEVVGYTGSAERAIWVTRAIPLD